MTIESLNQLGCNTGEGLARCLNNEAFYLSLVGRSLSDDQAFEALGNALSAGDTTAAFEAAHALKGVLANLSLTPLFNVASEITELLRAGKSADYASLYQNLVDTRAKFLAIK